MAVTSSETSSFHRLFCQMANACVKCLSGLPESALINTASQLMERLCLDQLNYVFVAWCRVQFPSSCSSGSGLRTIRLSESLDSDFDHGPALLQGIKFRFIVVSISFVGVWFLLLLFHDAPLSARGWKTKYKGLGVWCLALWG